jgi:hypothetical protein
LRRLTGVDDEAIVSPRRFGGQFDLTGNQVQPTTTCKNGAAFVPGSFELFVDSGIVEELGHLLADARQVHESLGFTITQTNGPVGLITALM